MEGGAEPPRAFGDRRHGERGFRPAVGRRMDATDPALGAARRHRLGLGRGQHVAAHLHLAGLVGPARPPGEVALAGRHIDEAGAAKAGLRAELLVQAAPHVDGALGQRQFAQIAVLLAAPAPVAAGLLAGDVVLRDDGHRVALLGEMVGGGDAGDAAADHDDVGGWGQRCIALDAGDGRGHWVELPQRWVSSTLMIQISFASSADRLAMPCGRLLLNWKLSPSPSSVVLSPTVSTTRPDSTSPPLSPVPISTSSLMLPGAMVMIMKRRLSSLRGDKRSFTRPVPLATMRGRWSARLTKGVSSPVTPLLGSRNSQRLTPSAVRSRCSVFIDGLELPRSIWLMMPAETPAFAARSRIVSL